MSDVVLNPSFKQDELDLLKSQAMDGLTYNLKQPGFLASYVASKYSFGEHPAGGTPESLNGISRADVAAFHAANYQPSGSVLIFAGDISDKVANELAGSTLEAGKRTIADRERPALRRRSTREKRLLDGCWLSIFQIPGRRRSIM